MVAPNTILNNRYRIIQQLGVGGMGAVYQAMDENLSCIVAVKETFADNEEHRRAFKREAELLANLTHAALPRVMDHFTHDNGQFLVMQFIPGNDLAELLTLRERPFPTERVLDWADNLLDALEELHSYRPPIIHRDIKPSNLKLTPKGKIILLDFGLAKGTAGQMSTVDADSSAKSMYGYTRHYAPLEQITGAGTDPRSDLYSLAATLWSLLTGELPPDALARVGEREEGNPDPLLPAHEKNEDVPEAIATVLNQAMALNRNQRPKSAAEMRKMLREASRRFAEEPTRLRPREEAALLLAEEEERRKRAAEEEKRREEEQRRAEKEEQERQLAEEAARQEAEEAARRRAEEEERLRAEAEERRRAEEEEAARAQAEAERLAEARRLEEQDRLRRDREAAAAAKRDAEQPSPVIPPRTEPTKERTEPHDPFAIKTIPVPSPPEPSYSVQPLTGAEEAATPSPGGKSRRTMLFVVIAFIAVLGAVALIFLMRQTGNSERTANNNGAPLSAEPGSQPVQPAQSPTGSGEQGITPIQAPQGMVYVPGGEFTMGRNDSDELERPAHKVTVKPYFIDIYEVTREEYRQCVLAQQCAAPSGWVNQTYPPGTDRKPVTGVTWDQAKAYVRWRSERDGGIYRLPTEEEWEFAARGADGRRYPWGNEWRKGLANADGAANGMADVGTFKGASPFGAFDMVGNAWEWTETTMLPYTGTRPRTYYEDLRVIRGGTYSSKPNQATTTYRRGWSATGEKDYSNTGFRCVREIDGSPK
ncbi:MAG TPA: bifunctional serine/threonine-protein kinase/formylglycine-generating enzyme family protein [Pyrinomonadaceae bacterium]